jgi:endonuclease/exonuclease/phosphatase family metal-dependent hydrolase
VNIYAPAQAPKRKKFYAQLLQLPLLQHPTLLIPDDNLTDSESSASPSTMIIPMIILGDFNYQAASYISTTTPSPLPILTQPSQKQWHEYINTHFPECTHSREAGHLLPTFKRGQVQSTIDYIYASPVLYQQLHSSSIDFIASDWTDHALLSAQFQFDPISKGLAYGEQILN